MFKRLVINYNNKFICFILTFPTLTGSSKENNKEESRQEGGDNPADGQGKGRGASSQGVGAAL